MSNPNGMPPVQPPSHRPPFPHPNSSYRNDYGMQNGRPSPANTNPQSPQMMTYSSPSPHYSPSFSHPPPPKRARLSEEPTSALSPPHYPPTPVGLSRSPVLGHPTNGFPSSQPRPGSMLPPQRPAEKPRVEDNYEDILAGTGVNVEEEERALSRPDYYSRNSFQNTPFNRQGPPGYPYTQMSPNGPMPDPEDARPQPNLPEPSPEEKRQRQEGRADWDAGRHSQNPLWDMFLYGSTLNDRIRKISLRERLADPQSGVLVNTQKSGPPPIARVNGLEGATRVIDRGQAILDSENKGQRLSEIMKLICLATKTRLTGLVNASARLSLERRQHSKGLVPTEWEDIAVTPRATSLPADAAEKLTPLKRTYSQANDDENAQQSQQGGVNRISAIMQGVARAEREAEEARRAKRAKRKPTAAADGSTPSNLESATEAELMAAVQDAEKKTTKKSKQAASDINPTVLAANANSAARMATMGVMSRFGGKKQKTYSWMTAGASGASTPTKPTTSATSSAANTPAHDRIRPPTKEKQFGAWDEDKDPGIQLRDVLPVLESDGMAPRAYIRGCERLES